MIHFYNTGQIKASQICNKLTHWIPAVKQRQQKIEKHQQLL